MHIHVIRYLPFMAAGIAALYFHISRWDYFKMALSDKGVPSATRLCGYVLTLVIAFCEAYTTMRTQVFDMQHLQWILGGSLAFFGILKISEVLVAIKGGKVEQTPTNPPQ